MVAFLKMALMGYHRARAGKLKLYEIKDTSDFKLESAKMFLRKFYSRLKFHSKTLSCSGVFVLGDRQKYNVFLRTKF